MVHLRGLLEAKDGKDERISPQRILMPCPNPGPNPSWRPGTWEVVVLFVSSVDGLFLTPKQFSYTVNPNLPKQGPHLFVRRKAYIFLIVCKITGREERRRWSAWQGQAFSVC